MRVSERRAAGSSSWTVGRPTKYRVEYSKLAAVLLAQGYTEAKVAEVLRVGPSTLSGWKRTYPEFAKALGVDEGSEPVDEYQC